MKSPVIKRSIVIAGHKTSVSLEDPFWAALKTIAAARGLTLAALIESIDKGRAHDNLSSALRLAVLDFYRLQIAMNRDAASEQAPAGPRRAISA